MLLPPVETSPAAQPVTPPSGCYLITYTPAGVSLVRYNGTLRVESTTGPRLASGDLYQSDLVVSEDPDVLSGTLVPAPPPDPAAGIPVLPIRNYRYYLRVTRMTETGAGFMLAFEALRFSAARVILLDGSETSFPTEGAFTALMTPASVGSPDHFAGDVVNEAGTVAGRLSMALVSPYLRRAVIAIDHVAGAEVPTDNGAGLTWRTLFDTVGWDVTLAVSTSTLVEPSGDSWSDAEAHAGMLHLRDRSDLDKEWRYHLLAVRLLDRGDPGIMFDKDAIDSNNVPREGCVIASDWTFSNDDKWGVLKGVRAGDAGPTYFRTAVHETGHAMGLEHNANENGIMRPTNGIKDASTPASPFPNNIHWSFARDDEQRLRHWPDIIVRPGGMRWTAGSRAPFNPLESDALRLEVSALLSTVPLGAPVRVNLALINVSDRPVDAPASLTLKSGFVRGGVSDASGTLRTFSPVTIDTDSPSARLEPGMRVSDSLTLFSGPQGALFPAPGVYRVGVEVSWPLADMLVSRVSGEATVIVTAAVNAAHADAARQVLGTPDTLLTLTLGGDHLPEGIAAIDAALHDDVLRPHFAYVEAKRMAGRFFTRQPDLARAAELIDRTTVMSPAEVRKAAHLAKSAATSPGAAAMAAKLKAWAAGSHADEDVQKIVRSL